MDTCERIAGQVRRVAFHNGETGYTVLRLSVPDTFDAEHTLVCHLPSVIEGEQLEATGGWVEDRKYGRQFVAQAVTTSPPHTLDGLQKYLSNGFIKGIGPSYAKRIVNHFGHDTLNVLNKSPQMLGQIPGLGLKRIEAIRSGWEQSRSVRTALTFLMSYGIGATRATRIYREYGEQTVSMIRQNPYRLAEDIDGVGFQTADEFALKSGLNPNSPQRARAAVLHVLREAASRQGHCCLPSQSLVDATVALTRIPEQVVMESIARLVQAKELVRDGQVGRWIYVRRLHQSETGIADRIRHLTSGQHPLAGLDLESEVRRTEFGMGITLAPTQRVAVSTALRSKLLVVTGGPGTGKTTIVRAILEVYRERGLRVELCAPTGRAAKRMTEACKQESRTIHRLLAWDPQIRGFSHNEYDPLQLDLLIVDEASMIDVHLGYSLLRAVPAHACVLFVGDVDQLPSVGPGNVLRDMIASGAVPVSRLTEIHRQAEASLIIRAAHAVNHGQIPLSATDKAGDFFFVEATSPEDVNKLVLKMVKERIPARFQLDPIEDIQVLSPMNKGDLGVYALNRMLQDHLNPGDLPEGGLQYRPGDKVIQTVNNYSKEVFNGDLGRVLTVDHESRELTVQFGSRPILYESRDLDELKLAYAISIHKSQGSEYPAVVIPVHTSHWIMLQRNLIYTAITRGKRLVVLVGQSRALAQAVANAEQASRFTDLRARLTQIGMGERAMR